jgi:hypothetical protein
MKYYKDINNEVYAFEDSYSDIDSTLVPISKQEALNIVNPPPTDAEVIAYNKKYKQEEITRLFNETAEAISNALPHEMASWRKQEDEARAYLADNSVSTPTLSALVVARCKGETVLDLATKVVANADAYASVYIPLLGKFQNKMSEITLAKTTADLTAIKF